jgi:Multiubiquitin
MNVNEIHDENDRENDRQASHNYRIQFALDNLDFRTIEVADPVPLGRQILTAAGIDPRNDYSIFAILPSGDFEDIRLDESFDLRGRGVEKFVAFHTDRDYKLTLDDSQITWGKPAIRGSDLYKLANVGNELGVFLEIRGGTDKLIDLEEMIDLTAPGIERFITALRPTDKIEIIVNARPKLVSGPNVTFEQIVELAYPGVHNPNTVFSITYRKAASAPAEGLLGTGSVITIKKGTIFNVTPTDKS